ARKPYDRRVLVHLDHSLRLHRDCSPQELRESGGTVGTVRCGAGVVWHGPLLAVRSYVVSRCVTRAVPRRPGPREGPVATTKALNSERPLAGRAILRRHRCAVKVALITRPLGLQVRTENEIAL